MNKTLLQNEQLKPILNKPWYLCYKLVWNDKKGKNDKVPFSPTGLFKMNPQANGAGYDKLRIATEASAAVDKYGYDGIGVVFRNDSPLAGIDIDDCLDENGNIAPLAADIVAIMDSYTEYSPNGKGLHILFFVNDLQLPWNKITPEGEGLKEVEIYTTGRFFTLTGDIYGQAKAIAERKAQAEKVIGILNKWNKQKTTAPVSRNITPVMPSMLSDNEILTRALNGKNRAKVQRLYNGDNSDYADDASRADAALCEILLIYADLDKDAVDRIFRTSARMRPKWDEIHDRKYNRTYGQLTLDIAYNTASANYTSQEEYKARKYAEEGGRYKMVEAQIEEKEHKARAAEFMKNTPLPVFYQNEGIQANAIPGGQVLFITRDDDIAKALADNGQYVINMPVSTTAQIQGLISYLVEQRPVCDIIFTYTEYKVQKEYKRAKGLPIYTAVNLSPVNMKPITQETIQEMKGLLQAPDNAAAYVKLSMLADMEGYKEAATNTTGFKPLDIALGGYAEGVYTMGAESGTGKTTFYWQMAEQIAATGKQVIFISVEQPRIQIITKSIARRLLVAHLEQPPTAHEIRQRKFTDELAPKVQSAWNDFINGAGRNIHLVEGSVIDYPVSRMRAYIERFIERTGQRPVVFIDYLQLLNSGNPKDGERENIIACYKEIKDLSKAEHLAIFLISSLNRQSYYTDISKEAMMGSGSIEYTSDALMALQLNCITADSIFAGTGSSAETTALKKKVHKEAMGAKIRLIKLSIIKNRNTGTGGAVLFEYIPSSDYFAAVGWEDYKGIKHFMDGYTRGEQWADIIRAKRNNAQDNLSLTQEEPEEESFINKSFLKYRNVKTGEMAKSQEEVDKWKKYKIPVEIVSTEEMSEWMK